MNINKALKPKLYVLMIIAVLLGRYSQDIAYYLYRNLSIPLEIGITSPTVLSLLLFIVPPAVLVRGDGYLDYKGKYRIYLLVNGVVAIFTSFFSVLVLIAWLSK